MRIRVGAEATITSASTLPLITATLLLIAGTVQLITGTLKLIAGTLALSGTGGRYDCSYGGEGSAVCFEISAFVLMMALSLSL